MADVTTEYKRLFLRGLKWDSEDKALSLYECLKAAARGRLTDTATGRVIVSTSGNGYSTTFSVPGTSSRLDQVLVSELCEELLTRFEEAMASLGLTDLTTADNDADIFSAMMECLVPLNGNITADFRSFNYTNVQ